MADSTRRSLEERIRTLELENRQHDPRFYASQKGYTEGDFSRGGSRRSSQNRPGVPMMFDLYFNFSYKNGKKCSLDNLVLFPMFSSLSLESPRIM